MNGEVMLAPEETWREQHAERVASVEAELKANPTRSDLSIARIAGISKASVWRIRARMEAAGEITAVPQEERVGVRGDLRKRPFIPDGLAGPRIKVPDGMTLVALIHSGIKIEEEGKTAEDAAYLVGVGIASYRQAKQIVMLSEQANLTAQERKITTAAIELMARERRTREAYEMVREIAGRMWGKGTNPHTKKTAQKIVEDFMNAISVILVACEKGKELAIPQLSAEDAIAVILQLKEAAQALKQLRSNLNRRIR
jgi:hypothetical protein